MNGMNIEHKLGQAVKNALKKLSIEAERVVLEHPEELAHGDFSTNVALAYAKQLKTKPRELSEKILAELEAQKKAGEGELGDVEKMEIAGPGFINFFLKRDFFVGQVQKIVEQAEEFGSGDAVQIAERAQQTLLIEHTSPNPNKAMHLGHLRNNITGMAVSNIEEFLGYNVIRDAVDNDRGIAIAKLMWGYLKFARKNEEAHEVLADLDYWFDHQNEWLTPGDRSMRPDKFVDALYVQGSEDFKNEAVEKTVRDFVVKWEAGDEKTLALWRKVLEYSHLGQELTLARLGNKWDFVWHEHEHYKMGKDLIDQGLAKGIFKKLDDGAILTNLEAYKIPDTILIKSDGTSLYITQDIALTKLKKEKFNPDKMFWVIGPEQSLAMKQVFAVCEQLGIGKMSDFNHLAYGYMSIKGVGKMSSREGNVIYIDDLIDAAKKEIVPKIKADKKAFNDDEIEHLSEMIAMAAIKYSILKAGRLSDIAFDFQTSLSFEGDSGPYLQYSCVRARSIVEKARSENMLPSFEKTPDTLSDLEKTIYRFPEVVARAGEEYSPHYIATFLIELSALFNNYYAHNKIIDAADPTSPYKVALTEAFAHVVHNGLTLLGIEVPKRM